MTTAPLEPDPTDPSIRPVDPESPPEDPPIDPESGNPAAADPDPTQP